MSGTMPVDWRLAPDSGKRRSRSIRPRSNSTNARVIPSANPTSSLAFCVGLVCTVESGEIEIEAEFQNFDDYWLPFLAGYGPASAYLLALPESHQAKLREQSG